jgi:threonine dehydrogenase-like Zn-dependent dehydrogenase
VPRDGSKQALVISMLSAKAGTTIDALIDATGWLPHTTRAALTGLRKRGFSIERLREDGGASVYRIVRSAAA